MFRSALFALLFATPALAGDSKEVSCGYQGDVAAAVQKARLDGVKKGEAESFILASRPTWPESYSKAIPYLIDFIYAPSLKMRDLRKINIGESMETQCLQQWDNVNQINKKSKG
ncbi:hypothetical protein [Seohaeicola zhoushanensis]|uniref:Uncharacterized protein n=1 Tax=Seohaeicola zhoushanensis TaxID=1569283 RepID=A0A8J3H288_9RHOB|nr:hypothetical protein [Seohaeicola zhoushanensis]GHF70284.1 hypothetical protein GCM10017056_46610 [Seohaeicola zhoushanensis]